MPRPCNASPSACTSARRSQRSSRSWTRSSTAWLSGCARAKHSVSCSELSSLPLRQRARPQARRSRSRSAAVSGPKVSRSLASRRMARARWGTRRVLLTRASVSSHRDDIDPIRVHAESARELVEGGEHPDRAKRKIPFEDRASIARRALLRFARLDSRAFNERCHPWQVDGEQARVCLRRHLVIREWQGSELLKLRSEEHTSELQSLRHLVCRLLLEKK